MQKITVQVPKTTLKLALRSTGENISATVKQALELLAARQACLEIRKLRGKIKLGLTQKGLRALREDRDIRLKAFDALIFFCFKSSTHPRFFHKI